MPCRSAPSGDDDEKPVHKVTISTPLAVGRFEVTYRLPTEAEWEYPARAGSTTKYSFSDDEAALGEYAWFSINSESRTHVVGGKKANPFGLHDMHGNVWEWVEDCYTDNYNVAHSDGSARTSNNCAERVLRDGAWFVSPEVLSSARRNRVGPIYQHNGSGFRVVRVLSPARTLITPYLFITLPLCIAWASNN
jgi:formylglycine-generating enzyme required for sulfatase activity